jgi:hypothetical protein
VNVHFCIFVHEVCFERILNHYICLMGDEEYMSI